MSSQHEPDDPATLPRPEVTSPPTRILVVDDSPLVRWLVARIFLERPDLVPVIACDAEEALAILDNDPPAVAVIDLELPGMDGLEMVRVVRRRHGNVPVILMTAYGSEQVAVQALRAGAANYVPKKDLVHELIETVDRVLSIVNIDQHRRRTMGSLRMRESTFELENDPDLITPLSNLLQEELNATGFCDRTTCIRVGVALTEALTNALFHGNLEMSSDLRQEEDGQFFALAARRRGEAPFRDRLIRVRARLDHETATYEIRDEGPGFDHTRIDHAVDPHDVTRIGGRGLILIRTFMDEVSFNEAGNQIVLVKRRGSADEVACNGA